MKTSVKLFSPWSNTNANQTTKFSYFKTHETNEKRKEEKSHQKPEKIIYPTKKLTWWNSELELGATCFPVLASKFSEAVTKSQQPHSQHEISQLSELFKSTIPRAQPICRPSWNSLRNQSVVVIWADWKHSSGVCEGGGVGTYPQGIFKCQQHLSSLGCQFLLGDFRHKQHRDLLAASIYSRRSLSQSETLWMLRKDLRKQKTVPHL